MSYRHATVLPSERWEAPMIWCEQSYYSVVLKTVCSDMVRSPVPKAINNMWIRVFCLLNPTATSMQVEEGLSWLFSAYKLTVSSTPESVDGQVSRVVVSQGVLLSNSSLWKSDDLKATRINIESTIGEKNIVALIFVFFYNTQNYNT